MVLKKEREKPGYGPGIIGLVFFTMGAILLILDILEGLTPNIFEVTPLKEFKDNLEGNQFWGWPVSIMSIIISFVALSWRRTISKTNSLFRKIEGFLGSEKCPAFLNTQNVNLKKVSLELTGYLVQKSDFPRGLGTLLNSRINDLTKHIQNIRDDKWTIKLFEEEQLLTDADMTYIELTDLYKKIGGKEIWACTLREYMPWWFEPEGQAYLKRQEGLSVRRIFMFDKIRDHRKFDQPYLSSCKYWNQKVHNRLCTTILAKHVS